MTNKKVCVCLSNCNTLYFYFRQRTENVISYLISTGLRQEDLIGNYYVELNPVVDCETKRCTNSDHALNRRTVVKLIKIE